MAGTLTWLGHGAFRIDSPGGKRIYLDPWLANPKCPESERRPERMDVAVLTHGHNDHIGGFVELGKQFSPAVVAIVEMADWFEQQGVPGAGDHGMNKGGTVTVDGIRFTMTNAVHSSSFSDEDGAVYLGDPAGFVIELEDGTKVYAAGDTAVFADMQLIGRLYEPDVAILPIGDHFTMGPREAALALELLGVRRCVPCHYGTFPILVGRPEELQELAPAVQVQAIDPGESLEL